MLIDNKNEILAALPFDTNVSQFDLDCLKDDLCDSAKQSSVSTQELYHHEMFVNFLKVPIRKLPATPFDILQESKMVRVFYSYAKFDLVLSNYHIVFFDVPKITDNINSRYIYLIIPKESLEDEAS